MERKREKYSAPLPLERERKAKQILLPPSFEELERRLTTRGKDSPEVIARRLEEAKRECALADRYAYNIVNDDVERAAGEFAAIIDKERAKRR